MVMKKEISFEEALKELETIVDEMENGDVALAELMKKYRRGVELSQKCLKDLDRAEKAMDVTVKEVDNEIVELKLEIEGE